jgi:hypothetical protein
MGIIMPPLLLVVTEVQSEFLITVWHAHTTHTDTSAYVHAFVRQLIACLFMYFPQVLKMAEGLLLTHQHQGICPYYSGW